MVRRMVGPRSISASALSKEVGVPQPTLSLWLKTAGSVSAVSSDKSKPRARRPEDWTPEEKLTAVMNAEDVPEAELGAWLRQKGLTEEHLRQWRELVLACFSGRAARTSSSAERKRIQELERELKRKDKALAETAALLVLQGKMEALWAGEDEPTRQSSDKPSSPTWRRRRRRGRG
jgi:hypothetical protein